MTTSPLNHYQVMMVDPEVDADILATVYRRLVQRYQSAVDGGGSALAQLQAVERAYEVLGDPHRRFRYDGQLSDAAERGDSMEPAMPAMREVTAMRVVTAVHDVAKQPAAVPVMIQRVAMAERSGPRQHTTATPAAPVTHQAPVTHHGPATHHGTATRTIPVSVLDFGRYAGWSLRQLAAHDPDYLEWLLRSAGGRQYRAEITALLPQR